MNDEGRRMKTDEARWQAPRQRAHPAEFRCDSDLEGTIQLGDRQYNGARAL